MTAARTTSPTAPMRPQDWTTLGFVASLFVGVWAAVARRWPLAGRALLVALGADLAGRWLSRRFPGPFPARFRAVLVHPSAEIRELVAALDPSPGERILEIGPGTGQHAVEVAREVGPTGRVDALDLQPEMLAAVETRAREQGLDNVVTTVGDACARLTYDDDVFDAAYLSSVLGELPDPDTTLGELHRVVRPGGRLVVSEIVLDPDFVRAGALRRRAEAAGFAFEERRGSPLMYLARLRV